MKDQLQQMHTAQQFTYTRSQVDQFADSHPRFDELGTLIEQELKLGFDLESAYRRAELLSPATHAAQTRDHSGSDPRPRRQIHFWLTRRRDRLKRGVHDEPRKPVGRREAIANAIKRVNGGL